MYTGMGCGDQEMFRNCADVQINSVVGSYPPGALGHAPPQGLVYTGSADNGLTPLVVTARVCIATEPYNSVEGMMINCFLIHAESFAVFHACSDSQKSESFHILRIVALEF